MTMFSIPLVLKDVTLNVSLRMRELKRETIYFVRQEAQSTQTK